MNLTSVRNISFTTVKLISIAFVTSLSGAAIADSNGQYFTMTVFDDSQTGRQVMEGKYDVAIQEVGAMPDSSPRSFEAMTSLCVAYAKSGDLDQAVTSCDDAIDSLSSQEHALIRRASSRRQGKAAFARYMAVALTNRGVLYAAMGETQSARKCFEKAVELRSGLDGVKNNLMVLGN